RGRSGTPYAGAGGARKDTAAGIREAPARCSHVDWPCLMTIREAGAALRSRRASCMELAEEALSAAHRDKLNAFVTITDELARKQAGVLDEELARGVDRGP